LNGLTKNHLLFSFFHSSKRQCWGTLWTNTATWNVHK